jgi:tungstate transport system ATP-binding protein
MMLYTLNNIRQAYGGRTVLQIDHLTIEAGHIHALLGPNGSGKTTLLDILAFLAAPISGEIQFKEQSLDLVKNNLANLRKQVVLVDQHPIMFSTSVSANIEYGLKLRKIAKKERQQTVDRVLEIVGLQNFRTAAAHHLSGGETQRLALARAIALEPSVLLCDEPTASVDSENQGIIESLLQRINSASGTTIIFTTHDRIQAAGLTQRTITLEHGRPIAATFENSFEARLHADSSQTLHCNLHNKVKFSLPFSREWKVVEKNPTDRLYISPEKINFRRPAGEAPTTEDIPGTVLLVMVEGQKIRMTVDTGVRITVMMDKDLYLRERPLIGETLYLQPAADGCSFMPHRPQ